jgi:hypothetical protein
MRAKNMSNKKILSIDSSIKNQNYKRLCSNGIIAMFSVRDEYRLVP